MEKSRRKCADPFSILVNNPKNSHYIEDILLKVRYFERELTKSLKKLTLFLLSNPVPLNRQNY